MEVKKKGDHAADSERNLSGSARTPNKVKMEKGFISHRDAPREAGKIILSNCNIYGLDILPERGLRCRK